MAKAAKKAAKKKVKKKAAKKAKAAKKKAAKKAGKKVSCKNSKKFPKKYAQAGGGPQDCAVWAMPVTVPMPSSASSCARTALRAVAAPGSPSPRRQSSCLSQASCKFAFE